MSRAERNVERQFIRTERVISRDDYDVIAAVRALEPNASGATVTRWLNKNRPRSWWKFWGWGAGTIYVSLLRLELGGALTSGWENSASRPRRRLYMTVAK